MQRDNAASNLVTLLSGLVALEQLIDMQRLWVAPPIFNVVCIDTNQNTDMVNKAIVQCSL